MHISYRLIGLKYEVDDLEYFDFIFNSNKFNIRSIVIFKKYSYITKEILNHYSSNNTIRRH